MTVFILAHAVHVHGQTDSPTRPRGSEVKATQKRLTFLSSFIPCFGRDLSNCDMGGQCTDAFEQKTDYLR